MGNPYEQEFQTDENGEINVELRVGEYTVSEVAGEDSEKYILPDDQTVEIKAGETTTVKMHNKLVPEVPTVPQTGDSPWMPPCSARLSCLRPCPAALCSSCAIPERSGKLPVAAMRIRAQKEMKTFFKRVLHRSFVPEPFWASLVSGAPAGADQ